MIIFLCTILCVCVLCAMFTKIEVSIFNHVCHLNQLSFSDEISF